LTGEGADEHFGGYSFFLADYFRDADISFNTDVDQRLTKLEAIESSASMWNDVAIKPMSYSDSVSSRRMLNGISTHRVLASFYEFPRELFTDTVLKHTGEPDSCFTMAASVDGIARFKANNKWHPLHTALYIQSHTMLPHALCNYLGDRADMAHAVETRVPFLDHPLTEYVNQLPPSVKIKYPTEKWILREAAKPYISEELYLRKKHPFAAPLIEAKKTPHGIYLNNRLTREAIEAIGWIRWDFVEKMKVSFFDNNNQKAQNLLNIILSLVIISEKFGVKPYGK